MLSICECYANQFNIKFNTEKSKCMFVPFVKQRASADNSLSRCSFYFDGRQMENVAVFSSLAYHYC